jgi:hypothetical protein
MRHALWRTHYNMPTNVAVPERAALRALYDEAIAELNPLRQNILTTDFYAKTGDAVFNAGYSVLADAAALAECTRYPPQQAAVRPRSHTL